VSRLRMLSPRDVLFVAAIGYLAGSWLGIHLALA
jgi:hypothetical protein